MPKIILASQSPRRKQLMEMAELEFEVVIADVDETNPPDMDSAKVPEHLAHKKANAIAHNYTDSIIVAADTIVLLDNEILGKPKDTADAVNMLKKLSGRMHQVISGVCIQLGDKVESFSKVTEVYFRPLDEDKIQHYVEKYQPFDKAGSYAIQEWIGLAGIEKINGDYYNVMGLPIGDVLIRLKNFL